MTLNMCDERLHSIYVLQMDNFDDVSIVNLDDDRDVNFADSADESGSDQPIDLGDQNVTEDLDVGDEQYKKVANLTTNEIRGLEFGSEEEAYQFYQTYAKCHGFVVRKDDVNRDIKGNIIMRRLVCNRAGLRNKKHLMRVDRKREHKPITRTNCQAKLQVHFNQRRSKWIVMSFEESHSHELIPSKFMCLILAYCVMTNADKAQVDSLHSCGARACHIMGYMVSQKGRYSGVGFTKKDLYNYVDCQKGGQIKDGDALAALSYLQGKADNDPLFFSKCTTFVDGKLKHLFWADGGSKADFQCFGDVLAFDTTYKNKYNYPLVIFSGCNHHLQTIIFGCALVADETTETYKWIFEAFLEAMCNKHPKVGLTDGDDVMREAIKQVFPDASHHLCAWHLHNNACENVKSAPFLDDFKTAMYTNFTPDQFEEYWKNIVDKHGLVGNKWVCKAYENKSLWATAYLRDKFFVRIRTTSQYEAINSITKTCQEKKHNS